jgi:hypothetical protein
MEQDSQAKIIEAQAREIFGRVAWSHKTQEKCADIFNNKNNFYKICQIALSAITSTGIFVTVFGDLKWVGVISAFISTGLLALNTYLKNYDLGQLVQKHVVCAAKLWDIRERYLSLLTDIKSESISIEEMMNKRDQLQIELYDIYKGAPRTIEKAYINAGKALKVNQELTLSDEEIDMFLPIELRKSK